MDNNTNNDVLTPAKISAPRSAEVYARERLFAELDKARQRPVIWISAPGGAGKTTLVSSYLNTHNIEPVWYQVDEGDADIGSFFYYLRLAAEQLDSPAKPLPLLTPEYSEDLPMFVRKFFRDLYQRLKSPGTLVFDNFQDVNAESVLLKFLPIGLEEIPAGTNVMIVSRVEPPPEFSRLLANKQISHLDWKALRLTEEEGRGVAQIHLRDNSNVDALVSELLTYCQGWVAGLVLLLEQASDKDLAILTKENTDLNNIFNYFATEIFQRSEAALQDFLLRTSFLPKISLANAEHVSGNVDAKALLQNLTQKNYFTVRHVEGSYEYHPLFRSFLLDQTQKHFAVEEVRAIQLRSAQALAASHDIDAAISLMLQAQEWNAALGLILENAVAMYGQGRVQTLLLWLSSLPDELKSDHPWVLYWLGACYLPFEQARARQCFEQAYERFEKEEAADLIYMAWTGIVDSFMIEWHDFKALGRWLDCYQSIREKYPSPSPNFEAASVFSYLNGMMFQRPADSDVEKFAGIARGLLERKIDSLFMQSMMLIYSYMWMREYRQGTRLLQIVEPHLQVPDAEPMVRMNWYVLKSVDCCLGGFPEEARKLAREGLEYAADSGVRIYDIILAGHAMLADVQSGHIRDAREIADRYFPMIQKADMKACFFLDHAAAVSLQNGDQVRALEEANRLVGYKVFDSVPFAYAMSHITRGIILGKGGDLQAGLEEVLHVAEVVAPMNSPMLDYCASLAEANIRYWLGEHELMMLALQKALSIAKRDGTITMPVWQLREEMSVLLNMALIEGFETEYVRTLILTFKLPAPDNITLSDHWPFPIKLYTFGEFRVVINDEALSFNRKAQKKPLELLKAILAQEVSGIRSITADAMAQMLWPDAELDKARHSLITTRSRLHKLLGIDNAIVLQDGKLHLNRKRCWVDAWALEQTAEQVASESASMTALDLYQGPFLGKDDEYWVLPARERLRSKFSRTLLNYAQQLEKNNDWQTASEYYQRGIEADPLAEAFYSCLMRCYQQLDRRAEALAVYRRCRQVLHAALGIEPGAAVQKLYQDFLTAEE